MSQAQAARYSNVGEDKADGATYTPQAVADFVAERILACAQLDTDQPLRILDPALGHGELLIALAERLESNVTLCGYETDADALVHARARLSERFPQAELSLVHGDFLEHACDSRADAQQAPYDLIIANPPYVRTQIMGAERAQKLAGQFGLSGRVDLYQAFLLGMAQVLAANGTLGTIVSNRLLTTRGAAAARAGLLREVCVQEVYDLGDTKLFDVAVLPAVLIAGGRRREAKAASFRSIYETQQTASRIAETPLAALAHAGCSALPDGRTFAVRHGTLDATGGVWRLASQDTEAWLATVDAHTWGTFRDIGKTRVGIKSCADGVFLPEHWEETLELHRPLTTHHAGRRFRPQVSQRKVLYPHAVRDGKKQAVDLDDYPASRAYLEAHRETLERRQYVLDAGRQWYELWVPQSPDAWPGAKLVFRDIAEQPMFWMDLDDTVVNGDCYWLAGDEERLWLVLGVANSTFIERFYDIRFNNKLYAGRRRFMTQYVEQFPLPDPELAVSREIVADCKALYAQLEQGPAPGLEQQIDEKVWAAFGLAIEEVRR